METVTISTQRYEELIRAEENLRILVEGVKRSYAETEAKLAEINAKYAPLKAESEARIAEIRARFDKY